MASEAQGARTARDPLLFHAWHRRVRVVLLGGRAAGGARAQACAVAAGGRRLQRSALDRHPARRAHLDRQASARPAFGDGDLPSDRRLRPQGDGRDRRRSLHARRHLVLGLGTRLDDQAAHSARAGAETRERAAHLPRDRPPARVVHAPQVPHGLRDRRRARRGVLPRRPELLAPRGGLRQPVPDHSGGRAAVRRAPHSRRGSTPVGPHRSTGDCRARGRARVPELRDQPAT